ncbi:MAG: hypothetical protein ACRCU5_15335 [Rhizobiaceae bacterium]
MDWDKAIERNREALLRIVAVLFGMIAAARIGGGVGLMVPRSVWRAVMIVLRPAEAAVRRLVLIAARGLAPTLAKSRPMPAGGIARADSPREPSFGLIDPLRDLSPLDGESGSWMSFVEDDAASFDQPDCRPDAPLNAARLHLRLRALRHALANLSKQARRLARWNARRDAALKSGQPTRVSPMRPGLPPGWRQRRSHEIDETLRECHLLARGFLHAPDTS